VSAPLKERLVDPLDEADVQRLWRGIGDRRGRARPRAPVIGYAFAAGAALVALLWLLSGRAERAPAGPLLLAGGGEIADLAAPTDARAVPLADGSALTLAPGARLRPVESSGSAFATVLESGRVDFDVHKGGPRRWSIACGLATVEVVGTRFTLDRTPARLRVEVREGLVLVRSDRLPDGLRRLGAGEAVEIDAPALPAPPAPPTAAPATPEPPPPPSAAPPRAPSARAAPLPAPAWRALAQRGDYKGAYQALGEQGISAEARTGTVEELLALADVARLSGHPAEAVAPLARVIDAHPGDARAALAAFTLGRLQLDTLGRPAAAAEAFSRALSLGLGASLVEDARARVVEARARAGDHAGARAAAAEYERLFPEGTHLAAVRRWTAE
jgi:transmembrane sensor